MNETENKEVDIALRVEQRECDHLSEQLKSTQSYFYLPCIHKRPLKDMRASAARRVEGSQHLCQLFILSDPS